MIMFKVGDTDYSNRVIANKYNINTDKEFEAWTDASGIEHHSLVRERTKGSFEMFFKTVDEIVAFGQKLANSSLDDMSVAIVVCDNKTNTEKSINAYVDYTPTRRKNGLNDDIMDIVKVSITER